MQPFALGVLSVLAFSFSVFADDPKPKAQSAPPAAQSPKPDVEALLRQLDDADYQIRERATKQLIELWEDDAVLKRVEEAHKAAKVQKKLEVEDRTEKILTEVYARRPQKDLENALGEEKLSELLRADEKSALAFFKEWTGSGSEIGRLVLQKENRQAALSVLVVERLKSNEAKHSFMEHVSNFRLSGCAIGLVRLLQADDYVVRYNAGTALRFLKARSVSAEIAKLLKHPRGQVRAMAARALYDTNSSEKYTKDIAALLKDEDGEAREYAIYALRERAGEAQYTVQIGALLKDPIVLVRRQAACTIGNLGSENLLAKSYAKDIAEMLNQRVVFNDPRGVAACALAELDAKEFAKDIAPLLKEKDLLEDQDQLVDHKQAPDVRAAAAFALGKLRAKDYAMDIARLLDDKVKLSYRDNRGNDQTVSDVAAKALKEMGCDVEKLKKEAAEKK